MGRGGKKIPKRYLKECPICKNKFRAKYSNRIYCSGKCRTKAFLAKYPGYHKKYYSKNSYQWTEYKENDLQAKKSIVKNDHLGTKSGDVRPKKESESWEDYFKYFRKRKNLILGER